MEEIKNTQDAQTKLTYEQLESAANQLAQQNQMLRNQLMEMNYHNVFKRLDYLFKVVEHATSFDTEFVTTCKTEIVTLMTPETIEETDTKEEA